MTDGTLGVLTLGTVGVSTLGAVTVGASGAEGTVAVGAVGAVGVFGSDGSGVIGVTVGTAAVDDCGAGCFGVMFAVVVTDKVADTPPALEACCGEGAGDEPARDGCVTAVWPAPTNPVCEDPAAVGVGACLTAA